MSKLPVSPEKSLLLNVIPTSMLAESLIWIELLITLLSTVRVFDSVARRPAAVGSAPYAFGEHKLVIGSRVLGP